MLVNNTNVPLSLAVWLANDEYDFNNLENSISVTSLLKSTRQFILETRINQSITPVDIISLLPSKIGQSIHTAIETTWLNNAQQALKMLSIPKGLRDKIIVNPSKIVREYYPDKIFVFIERRTQKEFNSFIISGKFDFIMNGVLEDFKSSSVYGYMNETTVHRYVLQGSMYKWLNPDIITEDYMTINYILKDWKAGMVKTNATYPSHSIMTRKVPLLSTNEIEAFIAGRIKDLITFKTADESLLPHCTSEELWQSNPVYKYYKNPASRKRSTKNFTDMASANIKLAQDGNTGIVVTVPGKIRACKYCAGFTLCKQKDIYLADNSLEI